MSTSDIEMFKVNFTHFLTGVEKLQQRVCWTPYYKCKIVEVLEKIIIIITYKVGLIYPFNSLLESKN